MKNPPLMILFLILVSGLQNASAMSSFFQESIEQDGLGTETIVVEPTEETVETIEAIGQVGAIAESAGIPFASYIDEVAYGIVGLAGIFHQARRAQRHKKEARNNREAAKTMAKGVFAGTTDGTIKRAIRAQSGEDGTTEIVHAIVREAIPRIVKPDPQMKLPNV